MQKNMNLINIVKKSDTTIIDVRSEAEFIMANFNHSINIALDQIPNNVDEIAKMQPVVLCCAAGVRSEQAVHFLKENGLTQVYNGGSWNNVQAILDS
jgi:rhodanese-related sulfurtransferase